MRPTYARSLGRLSQESSPRAPGLLDARKMIHVRVGSVTHLYPARRHSPSVGRWRALFVTLFGVAFPRYPGCTCEGGIYASPAAAFCDPGGRVLAQPAGDDEHGRTRPERAERARGRSCT